MAKKRKPMTAAKLLQELNSDPEWVARDREREASREAFSARIREEARPVLEDLAKVGFPVRSVYDLVNTSSPYPEAIPILLEHLGQPYHPRIREGLARALTVREAQGAVPQLIEAFRQDPDVSLNGPKWALGNALYFLAGEEFLPDILDLSLDSSHGPARHMLIYILARSPDVEARAALEKLREDPDVGPHIDRAIELKGRAQDG